MCLKESTFIFTNNIILYGTLILAFLYLSILILKKIKPKKIKLNIIIVFIILLLVNTSRIYLLKKCDNNELNENIINSVSTTLKNQETKSTTITTTTSTTTTKNNNEENKFIGTTNKGYSIYYRNGAYYVDNYLIVNKTYSLNENYVPTNTNKKITESMDGFCRECIEKEAYENWIKMKNDAASLNLSLWIQSGYRSYDYQKDLYNGYVNRKGKQAADKSSARPGHSEHQTALAFDLNTITTDFKDTDEGKWVNNNCYLYGYIIRYPEGKNNETGYIFEPWHIRYVGKNLAEKLYNNGNWITMEEYFGIDSVYQN